jgi:hypothetical protein
MNRFGWYGAAAVLWAGLPALAQQIVPHIGYVYPAGGRQGQAFDVTVGGQYLDGVANAYLTGPGVQVAVVKHTKLMTMGQLNRMREELQELTEKRGAANKRQKGAGAAKDAKDAKDAKPVVWTAADDKRVAEIREVMVNFIRKPASAAIAETVLLRVTVAANAAPGERELRLTTPVGMTNPMVFCVGQLPEVTKAPAKVSPDPESVLLNSRFRGQAKIGVVEAPVKITLPATINGQICPGGVDRYTFQATKGQHLVVAVAARELIPYISDAVPGWFQASAALFDPQGKEVDYADHYRFHPDPVLYYDIPADGEYALVIHDSIYRGREDFVYRIAVGELPFLTGIFPLGGKAGGKTTVDVKGWNLPVSHVLENDKDKKRGRGVFPLSVRRGDWVSNHMPFAVDTLPEVMDKEPNNDSKHAQKVKVPVIVNGHIDRPGDWDVFRVDGRAGEEIIAEVFARRLESPLDSILKLTDAKGTEVAVNDDFADKGAGLITHQADSRLLYKLPVSGAYYLYLGDTQHKGGPEYAYRLRISRPQPDFELRVVPSAINARMGTNVPVTVYALRHDGFDGEIAVRLKDAPAGFALGGAWIPPGQDKVRMTLTVPPSRIEQPRNISIEGRATIQGKEVHHIGIPAEDMMQAFFYRHLVPSQDLLVRVTGATRGASPFKLTADKPVRLPSGGSAPVRVTAQLGRVQGEVRFALNEPPDGITLKSLAPSGGGGLAFTLIAEAGKVKPGLRGNLIVDAYIDRATAATSKTKANRFRQQLGTLPAIPFEVVTP